MATKTSKGGGGTLWGWGEPSEQEMHQARKAAELEKLAEKYEQLGAMQSVGRGLWASADGRLWQPDRAIEGHSADGAFAIDQALEPVWFQRPKQGPRTVAELEVRREREAKAADRQERERQAQLKALRKTALPVTFGQVETSARGVTLAEAARRIANVGGTVEVEGGRLVVSLPPSVPGGVGLVLVFCRMLYAAEDVVTAALKSKAPLPEREVLPSGALAPE
jgi:hypothetical protein